MALGDHAPGSRTHLLDRDDTPGWTPAQPSSLGASRLDNAFYFSTGSLAARNLAVQPAITVHLESGEEVVIVEGVAEVAQGEELLRRVGALYDAKYHWDNSGADEDPFYAVHPQVVFGWVADSTGQEAVRPSMARRRAGNSSARGNPIARWREGRSGWNC